MKKILLLASAFLTMQVNAQIQMPKASPLGKIEQKVGLADISISYSRPGKKNRDVFGEVVPFGEIWRLGANENTKISTSENLIFGKDTLKIGTYALYAKPTKEIWELYFYSETTNWGMPEKWDDAKVVLRLSSEVKKQDNIVENLTISLDNLQFNGATLSISWDRTQVNFPFELDTKSKVLASIKKTMAGPSANDFHQTATYYFQEKIDLKLALEYSTKACEMRGAEAYWMSRLKAQLQAENGDFKGAIETAKQSIEAAEKDGDQNYVRMNKASIEEWSKKK